MSAITTHVLDTSRGRPAAGVPVVLEVAVADLPARGGAVASDVWREIGRTATNADGRARDLLPSGSPLAPGIYKITFDTRAYFDAVRTSGFYPWVSVIFEVRDGREHYHVPLLLNPHGYSTYRGS